MAAAVLGVAVLVVGRVVEGVAGPGVVAGVAVLGAGAVVVVAGEGRARMTGGDTSCKGCDRR